MPRESPYRVAIANANVPNMLGADFHRDGARRAQHPHDGEQVAGRDGLHAGRRGQPGVDEAVVAALSAIEGVLSVRAIAAESSIG